MKKILFNDKFSLTQAVLDGRKTQTRRIYKTPANAYGGLEVEGNSIISYDANGNEIVTRPKYQVGEVVAVAQAYRDTWQHTGYMTEIEAKQCAGYSNKLFVRADLMKHFIRITDVGVERLQDISDEDCVAEGAEKVGEVKPFYRVPIYHKSGRITYLSGETPREAYAALIDRISGKGVWSSNPYVFAYTFELVK